MSEEQKPAKQSPLKRRKRSKAAIRKMVATKKAKRLARMNGDAQLAKELPLRMTTSVESDTAEFAAFMAAAWRVYKGL
jgi:hypothetical protein